MPLNWQITHSHDCGSPCMTSFLTDPFAKRALMHNPIMLIAIMAVPAVFASKTTAQSARDIRGPSPLVAIENEAPAKLIVDPPLPEPLASGRVFIQYRTENLRVMPVFGKGALAVSPRIGHIHITVDDTPWHFVDASGETIILVGLVPGPRSEEHTSELQS